MSEKINQGGVTLSNISGSSINIGNISANIKAGGDVVGGDKISTTAPPAPSSSPQARLEAALSAWQQALQPLINMLDDEDDREYVEKIAHKMGVEAQKGDGADLAKVEGFLDKLGKLMPDSSGMAAVNAQLVEAIASFQNHQETAAADDDFADLQIRLFPKDEAGYLVEMLLDGEKVFPRGHASATLANWVPNQALDVSGQELFKLLFEGRVLSNNWAEACGHARQRRLRLWVDLNAPELHALPWELLHDGQTALAANVETPFSRYLPISRAWGSAVQTRPVRVLVAISNPDNLNEYGLTALNIEAEREALQRIAAEVDDLEMTFLQAPITLDRLEDALQTDYHILHYIGHGKFNPRRQKAALFLQDERGQVRVVDEEALTGMLARQGVQLRLVVLSACQTAVRSSSDAFLGLGPKLVSIGVPAVLAMQDEVSVLTAQTFNTTFYQRLLAHGQVDLATNQARSKLLTTARPDAAVPVLFMRLKSGRLWER